MPTNYNSYAAAVALVAALGAGGVAAVTSLGSNGCIPTTYTVEYTDNAFKAASMTATKTLTSLADARQKLCGPVVVSPQTAFAGTGISAMTCKLGTATTSPDNSEKYATSLNMMQTTADMSRGGIKSGRDFPVVDADLDVVLTCNATGANFGNGSATALTAGKVWVTVSVQTLPAGT